MHDVLLSPIRLNELEALIQNSVRKVLEDSPQSTPPTEPNDEAGPMLNIHQAAEFLNLTVPTIYTYVHEGKIPHYKPTGGKRLYFSKHELREWIKAGRKKTLAEIEAEAEQYLTKKKGR
jgi:excisionase family DNA binding protein